MITTTRLSLSIFLVLSLVGCGGGGSSSGGKEPTQNSKPSSVSVASSVSSTSVSSSSSSSNDRIGKTLSELNIQLSGMAQSGGLSYPNSDVLFCNGKKETILWNPSSFLGTSVDLYLLEDDPSSLVDPGVDVSDKNMSSTWTYKGQYNEFGAKLATLKFRLKFESVANTGMYEFDPAAMGAEGNAYLLLVVSHENSNYFDVSDYTIVFNKDISRPQLTCN